MHTYVHISDQQRQQQWVAEVRRAHARNVASAWPSSEVPHTSSEAPHTSSERVLSSTEAPEHASSSSTDDRVTRDRDSAAAASAAAQAGGASSSSPPPSAASLFASLGLGGGHFS